MKLAYEANRRLLGNFIRLIGKSNEAHTKRLTRNDITAAARARLLINRPQLLETTNLSKVNFEEEKKQPHLYFIIHVIIKTFFLFVR